MRENYLVEHTVGSIIRDALKIYFRHFGTLFPVYVLPSFPVTVIQQEAQLSGNTAASFLVLLPLFFVIWFAYAATTIAVSDVCMGNPPSIKRSYGKAFGKVILRLFGTSLLSTLLVVVAFALLVIPGLVLGVWLMLSPAVVVLEGKSGMTALWRSKELGDGSHWRNGGLLLLISIINLGFILVVGNVIGGVSEFFFPNFTNTWIFRAAMAVVNSLCAPFALICFVLVYYDRRVRKEGYDAKALAEDLAR